VDDADVLVVWLDLAPPRGDAVAHDILSDAERARVERLATDVLRRRAAARFSRRRVVLAELLGVQPTAVELETDVLGRLVARTDRDVLAVSTSSSEDVGLLAIASGRRLGADVEAVSEVRDEPGFTRRVATDREAGVLDALGPDARVAALARLWTRKESYLKATGAGIGDGVKHVEVPLEAGLWHEPVRPVLDGAEWLLYDLASPRPGFVAALVVEPGAVHPEVKVSHR
jgi:4'-phosphopantetheinyl transferase